MRPGNDPVDGVLGFFVPSPQEGEDLDTFEKNVNEEIDSQIWLICMTLQGFNYEEVMRMPEKDRVRWAERCEEYQDKMQEEINSAKSR